LSDGLNRLLPTDGPGVVEAEEFWLPWKYVYQLSSRNGCLYSFHYSGFQLSCHNFVTSIHKKRKKETTWKERTTNGRTIEHTKREEPGRHTRNASYKKVN
jgi:hypothetical protein